MVFTASAACSILFWVLLVSRKPITGTGASAGSAAFAQGAGRHAIIARTAMAIVFFMNILVIQPPTQSQRQNERQPLSTQEARAR
jgi:preprotein translocase subunit SecG